MTPDDDLLWQTKLAARLHDPVEKALVLMRTAESHEQGTSRELRQLLGLDAVPRAVHAAVGRADRWASAADRAAFPNRDDDGRYPAWQRVRFDQRPVIIHPLTGQEAALARRYLDEGDFLRAAIFGQEAAISGQVLTMRLRPDDYDARSRAREWLNEHEPDFKALGTLRNALAHSARPAGGRALRDLASALALRARLSELFDTLLPPLPKDAGP
jgi:hypothetical protein